MINSTYAYYNSAKRAARIASERRACRRSVVKMDTVGSLAHIFRLWLLFRGDFVPTIASAVDASAVDAVLV